MSQQFNSGNVPYGSFIVALKKLAGGTPSATDPANWKLEDMNVTRPGRVIDRPDNLGAPNGWVLEEGQETGTAIIQIQVKDFSKDYPKIGMYFDINVGYGGAATGAERWVITNVGNAYPMSGYWKANINLQLDRSGAGTNAAFS